MQDIFESLSEVWTTVSNDPKYLTPAIVTGGLMVAYFLGKKIVIPLVVGAITFFVSKYTRWKAPSDLYTAIMEAIKPPVQVVTEKRGHKDQKGIQSGDVFVATETAYPVVEIQGRRVTSDLPGKEAKKIVKKAKKVREEALREERNLRNKLYAEHVKNQNEDQKYND